MSGVGIMVGSLRQMGPSHFVALMRRDHSMRVSWEKAWGTFIGDMERLNIPHMAKVAGLHNNEHTQQMLETIADLRASE